MKKVLVLVEGQTEEMFIKYTLSKYLNPKGIFMIPTLATTKGVKTGKVFKGGIVSYGKVKFDLQQLLKDTSAVLVSTMIDFYGLPTDFPGYNTLPAGTCFQRVGYIEKAFKQDINEARFLPYFSLHEFEALLFSRPDRIVEAFPDQKSALFTLNKILQTFKSPEEINQKEPPSKRLQQIFPDYEKLWHGYFIADEIGIDEMRQVCRHFDGWLNFLETQP